MAEKVNFDGQFYTNYMENLPGIYHITNAHELTECI
jgi:hypothetical protein